MNKNQLKIGRKVKTTREFSGVPEGTEGTIVEASNSWPENKTSVAIQWNRFEGDTLQDWFSVPGELPMLDVAHSEYVGGEPLHINLGGFCTECEIWLGEVKI